MLRLAKICRLAVSSRLICRRNYAANELNFGSQEIPSKPKFVPCGGASFVQNVCNPRSDDIYGSRYLSVICKAMLIEGFKALEAGANAKDLKYGIDMAHNVVHDYLRRTARMVCTPKDISQVATAAASGDTELASFVAKGMEKVGKDGLYLISEDKKLNNELEFVNALVLRDWHMNKTDFFDAVKKRSCLLKNPFILVLENNILNKNVVRDVQQAIRLTNCTQPRPLLIFVEDVEDGLEGSLISDGSCPQTELWFFNPDKKGRATWRAMINDVAILTGGQVVTRELEMKFIPQMLGSCKMVTVSYEMNLLRSGWCMLFYDAAGDQKKIINRRKLLRSAITVMKSSPFYKTRLQFLSQSVRFKLGGASNHDKILKVAEATKMAKEIGILPGLGVALFNASKELDKLQTTNPNQRLGVQILQIALKMPVYCIADAAGFDGSVAVEKLLEQENPDLGFDPATGEYIEMVESGNIDRSDILIYELEYAIRHFTSHVLTRDFGQDWLNIVPDMPRHPVGYFPPILSGYQES